jgi:DNA end-binding protein Ku
MPLDKALVLNLMRFPQELVAAEEFNLPQEAPAKYRITPKESEMAQALVEAMVTKWNPEDYKDDFREKLRQIIDEQIARQGGKPPKPGKPHAVPGAATNVVDFMSLLRKSLESGGKAKKKTAAVARRKSAGAKKRKAG